MSLGYRVFFVEGDNLQRISQRQFRSLYRNRTLSLSQYAGQTVLSVMVFYELVSRKPARVVRIDTQKIRFDGGGKVDEEYELEGMGLLAAKLNSVFGDLGLRAAAGKKTESKAQASSDVQTSSAIVDASDRFNERRWNQRHPELSGPLLKKVLEGVFGAGSR